MTTLAYIPATRTRRNDEERLQRDIVWLLTARCRPCVWWEAVDAGVNLSKASAARRKAMGVRRGSPDLHFILEDGRAAFIELKRPKVGKAAAGKLTTEQEAFMDWCVRNHVPHAVVTSMSQAVSVLTEWGVISGVTV